MPTGKNRSCFRRQATILAGEVPCTGVCMVLLSQRPSMTRTENDKRLCPLMREWAMSRWHCLLHLPWVELRVNPVLSCRRVHPELLLLVAEEVEIVDAVFAAQHLTIRLAHALRERRHTAGEGGHLETILVPP